jgi:hypothetical protein
MKQSCADGNLSPYQVTWFLIDFGTGFPVEAKSFKEKQIFLSLLPAYATCTRRPRDKTLLNRIALGPVSLPCNKHSPLSYEAFVFTAFPDGPTLIRIALNILMAPKQTTDMRRAKVWETCYFLWAAVQLSRTKCVYAPSYIFFGQLT